MMKRVSAAFAAILTIFFLCGTIPVGAAEEVYITYTVSLDSAAIAYDDIKAVLTELPDMATLLQQCTVTASCSLGDKTSKLHIENGAGAANISLTYDTDDDDTITVSFTSATYGGVAVFDAPNKVLSRTASTSELNVNATMGWSAALLASYNAQKGSPTDEKVDAMFGLLPEEDSGNGFVEGIIDKLDGFATLSSSAALISADSLFASDGLNSLIATSYDTMYPTAFTLMCVLWLFGIGKQAVTTDLYNKGDLVKPLLRLVWGIGIMAISMPLLELIFGIFHRLAAATMLNGTLSAFGGGMGAMAEDLRGCVSNTPIIGGLKTIFNVIKMLFKYGPVLIINVVFGAIFYIIIALRFIKLAVLQCISPFFFACGASEKTDRYLHSFLREYIVLAAQILVAGLVYAFLGLVYSAAWDGETILTGGAVSILLYLAGMIAAGGSGKLLRHAMS